MPLGILNFSLLLLYKSDITTPFFLKKKVIMNSFKFYPFSHNSLIPFKSFDWAPNEVFFTWNPKSSFKLFESLNIISLIQIHVQERHVTFSSSRSCSLMYWITILYHHMVPIVHASNGTRNYALSSLWVSIQFCNIQHSSENILNGGIWVHA